MRRLLWLLLTILAAILFLLVAKNDGAIIAGTSQPDLVSLTVKIALAASIGALILTLLRKRFSRALETAMLWIAVAVLLAVGYGFRSELRDVTERLRADYLPSRLAPRNRVVEITRGGQGNFAVAVHLNNTRVSMVLDTGASQTLISPDLARRAGMQVTRGAPLLSGNVVGGRRVSVPLVRARSLSVGAAAVEDLDIGVFDALPGRPEVDGLLGASFLHHFKFTVDRKNLQLLLEPVAADK